MAGKQYILPPSGRSAAGWTPSLFPSLSRLHFCSPPHPRKSHPSAKIPKATKYRKFLGLFSTFS